jgi:hypothetical protein
LLWLAISLAALGLLTATGPIEKVLGANARIVYLHGAWVWASLAAFTAAGVAGAAGLAWSRKKWQIWSRALGRTGLLFWITYLPISMWAMQTSWNGLYLAEPRFRLAVIFSISGLLLQIGLTLLDDPAWAAGANAIFITVLWVALSQASNVMHPPSPMLTSNAPRIQAYFALLFGLTLFIMWQVARWWRQREPATGGA